MDRRTFLQSTATAVAVSQVLGPGVASAKARPVGKLIAVERNRLGTTLQLELSTAPYPHSSRKEWTDSTVWVYVPKHLRIKERPGLEVILHLHGHRDTAERAMKRHRLRAQLYDSRQNAILVVPQGPVKASSSDFGKLEDPRGLVRFLSEMRRTISQPSVAAALQKSAIPLWARVGRLVLSAHSGGYRGVAKCLEHGAWRVDEVWLFDALYGEVAAFEKWLVDGKGKRKFWCFYRDPTPKKNAMELIRRLSTANLPVLHEPREGMSSRRQLMTAKNIFIASAQGHDNMLWRRNAFRDCCLSSGFKRYKSVDWLKGKNGKGPRKLEPRPP